MSTIKYTAFVKVAELGSLTKAADSLAYSQPGISHMVASLEKEFGFPLINRSHDICTLTENGKRLLPYFEKIIENETLIRNTVQDINGFTDGHIRISATNSLLVSFVPKVIHAFSLKYPDVTISLEELLHNEVISSLRDGYSDIGFLAAPVPSPLQFTHLANDPVCALLPAEHPLNQYERVPVKKLAGYDFILPVDEFSDSYEVIRKAVKTELNVKCRVASDFGVAAMVSNGIGVSVMSAYTCRLLHGAYDISVKPLKEDFHRELGVAVNPQRVSANAVKAFHGTAVTLATDQGYLPV